MIILGAILFARLVLVLLFLPFPLVLFFLGFAFYMLPIISYQFNFVLEPKGITVKLPSTTLELR